MNNSQPLLRLNHVCLQKHQRHILKDISFTLSAGEIISLIGPNGAGKTTLLRLILGLEQPSSGSITFKPNARTAYMPQQFQVNNLLPLSVGDFLQLNARANDIDLLQQLEIDTLLQKALQDISGGELQRVLLARALIKQPELLILDEPAQGIDVHGQAQLYAILEDVKQSLNCGILMVSHDLHIVMAKTNAVICLNQHICCLGRPEEISQHPEYIALFGQAHADKLAIYNHHHDHHHDVHGDTHAGTCSHD